VGCEALNWVACLKKLASVIIDKLIGNKPIGLVAQKKHSNREMLAGP